MTEEFLQEANKLLYEKIKGNGKSSKAIYKKLSQFFRLPIDDEEDFLLKRGNEILPCRYTSDNIFRKQSDRIMDISEKKLIRKKKSDHPEIRLSVNSLLAIQLFSILDIDINDFLSSLAYRLDCEDLNVCNKEKVSESSYSEDEEKKQRKENLSLEEVFNEFINTCANIYLKVKATSELNLSELSGYQKNIVNLFYDQLFHDIRKLEKLAETSALEKSQIKLLRPKIVKNNNQTDIDIEEDYTKPILEIMNFAGANNSNTINYLEIRPQLYIYASYLIVCLMLNILKRIKRTQDTGTKQTRKMVAIKFVSSITNLPEQEIRHFTGEKGNTSKIGINTIDKNILDTLTTNFEEIKQSFDILLSYLARLTSTSFNDEKEEQSLRKLLKELTEIIFKLFEKPTLNYRRPKIFQYDSIQEILHTNSLYDYSFQISEEKLSLINNLKHNSKDICETIINEIIKYESFKEPSMSTLQKDAQDFIFDAWKRGINPIIALDMGCGKTRVACTTIKRFQKENKEEKGYILVVIPAGLKADWKDELEKNNNLKNCAYLFDNSRSKYFNNNSIQYVPQQVFVTSYDIAAIDDEKYKSKPPVMIIYDELQSINTSKILEKCLVLAELNEKVKYKFALSGTPMQNDTTEFFVNYCFFHDSDFLKKAYKSKLIKQDSWEADETFKRIKQELKSKNYYFFGREDNKLHVDEKFVPIIIADNHYKELNKFGKNERQDEMQYLLNPRDFDFDFDSAKTLFVKQIVKELASKNEKVIVFSYYKKPLRYLYKELMKYKPTLAIGKSLDDDDSSEIIDLDSRKEIEKFKDPKNKSMVLLGTIKMIGTGENLEVANHLIILDLWWNPMVIIQAMYRIKRKSQTKPVHIYFPIYTDKKGSPIDSEKNYLETMNRKIKSYNSFLSSIGYDQYANRTLPKITLKEPLFFDQNVAARKEWLLKELQNDSKTKTADWIKEGRKVIPVKKKK